MGGRPAGEPGRVGVLPKIGSGRRVASPLERTIRNYCAPRGIPRSTFLCWRPDDIRAALEWQAEEDGKCPGCGKPRHETFASEELVEAGLAPDYVAKKYRCRACEARDAAVGAERENAREAGAGASDSGAMWAIEEVRLNGNGHHH